MELYVVYFESANYAGYGEHCLVWANSVEEAMENEDVASYAEDFYYDQDCTQYYEEHEDEEPGNWASIMSAVPLKDSEFEEFVSNQPEFYPIVNAK